MGDIVSLASSKNEDGSLFYIFFYKNANYAMIFKNENTLIEYGEATFEGSQVVVSPIDMEQAQLLFDDTYDVFFKDEENIGLIRLVAFLTNEWGTFGLYTDDYNGHSETYFYEIINHEPVIIKDELKKRRLIKWFDDYYAIRGR